MKKIIMSLIALLPLSSNVFSLTPLIIKNEKNSVEECHSVGGSIIDANDIVYQNKPFIVAEEGVHARRTRMGGKFSLKTDGTYIYTARCGAGGIDTIVTIVCDTQTPNMCKNDTLFMTVTSQPPIAINDVFSDISGSLGANDSPTAGVPNIWLLLTGPINEKGEATGSVVVNIDGTFVYTPPISPFVGTITFTYQIIDEYGNKSVAARVTLTINTDIVSVGVNKRTLAFPNPARRTIFIPYQLSVGLQTMLTILDSNGRIIAKQLIDGSSDRARIDVSSFVKGIYTFVYMNHSGRFIIK